MFVKTLVLVPLLGLCACSDLSMAKASADSGTSDTGSAFNGGDGDTASGDEAPAYIAKWYSLAGDVAIKGGAPTLAPWTVHLVLADASLVRLDCEPLAPSDLATAEVAPEGMYAWWTFSVPDGGNCGDAEVVAPASLGMGIGPLDPEVRARLGTVDLDGEADQLWGGWLAAEEGEPSAFGYAQPSTGGISADAPPPDGTYTLEPLLLHPLPLAE